MPASRFQVPFERTFVFDGSPGDLWDAIALLVRRNDFDERLFHYELHGRPLETGSTVDVEVTPPLPYRVHLQIQFSESTGHPKSRSPSGVTSTASERFAWCRVERRPRSWQRGTWR